MARRWESGRMFSLLAVAVMFQLQPFSAPRSIPAQEGSESDNVCNLCIEAVLILRNTLDSNKTWQDAIPAVEPLCAEIFDTMGLNGTFMCPGLLNAYAPIIAYVLADKTVQPSSVCESLEICLRTSGLTGRPATTNSKHGSHLNMLATIHETAKSKSKTRGHYQDRRPGSHTGHTPCTKEALNKRGGVQGTASNQVRDDSPLKILQLTDVHLDVFYQEGASIDCGLYICCRPWYPGSGRAGRYGEYNCDLPLATLDLMLDTVKSMDIDFVLYTGDNPPHDMWNETYESQLLATKVVVNRLSDKLGATLIYPALGNHETLPESEYLAQLPLYQNITKVIAGYWAEWFPMTKESVDTVSRGAYYTTEVCDGLRIVAINSDYGYTTNIYTLINQQNSYFYEHSSWVHSVLSDAESKGEKVLLLAHIPPNPKDASSWYIDFLFNITKRYQKTIVGFITGHTHKDEFRLLQDEHGVYSAVMVAPSLTTQSGTNPSFRVYSMDRNTFQLLDYQQYHLNLTRANALALEGLQPEFELAYSASDEYGMEDLSTASWSALAGRFVTYNSLLQRYAYNMGGRSQPYGQCDSQCQMETICVINHPGIDEYSKCVTCC